MGRAPEKHVIYLSVVTFCKHAKQGVSVKGANVMCHTFFGRSHMHHAFCSKKKRVSFEGANARRRLEMSM